MTVEIVAEIGSNWDGDHTILDHLAYRIANAGANTLKVQHYPDQTYGPWPPSTDDLQTMQAAAHKYDLGFLASVFDHRTLEEYLALNPGRVKIASPELTKDDLLQAIPPGIKVILSTGMSTLPQIDHAITILHQHQVTLLHCTSAYPAPPGHMNLRAIRTLQNRYRHPVGLSDHSQHPSAASVAAVTLGAVLIEKHVTLNRHHDGPDHHYAIQPDDVAELAEAVRLTEQMLGDGVKQPQPSEDPTDRR